MTTVFSDDALLGPPSHVSKYSIREHLARAFPADEEFLVLDACPYAGNCEFDLIHDYSRDPRHETHPFMRCRRGQRATEGEFGTLVKAMHCIHAREL